MERSDQTVERCSMKHPALFTMSTLGRQTSLTKSLEIMSQCVVVLGAGVSIKKCSQMAETTEMQYVGACLEPIIRRDSFQRTLNITLFSVVL